jgi:hypothetical protein
MGPMEYVFEDHAYNKGDYIRDYPKEVGEDRWKELLQQSLRCTVKALETIQTAFKKIATDSKESQNTATIARLKYWAPTAKQVLPEDSRRRLRDESQDQLRGELAGLPKEKWSTGDAFQLSDNTGDVHISPPELAEMTNNVKIFVWINIQVTFETQQAPGSEEPNTQTHYFKHTSLHTFRLQSSRSRMRTKRDWLSRTTKGYILWGFDHSSELLPSDDETMRTLSDMLSQGSSRTGPPETASSKPETSLTPTA